MEMAVLFSTATARRSRREPAFDGRHSQAAVGFIVSVGDLQSRRPFTSQIEPSKPVRAQCERKFAAVMDVVFEDVPDHPTARPDLVTRACPMSLKPVVEHRRSPTTETI